MIFIPIVFGQDHPYEQVAIISNKIEFDVSRLNAQGLYGPEGGLRSLSYEFCIPADEDIVVEIKAIDSDIEVFRQSPGRINCLQNEYLCMGETYNKAYQQIFKKLAAQPFIKRIVQSDFE